jgi:hypothetical protein
MVPSENMETRMRSSKIGIQRGRWMQQSCGSEFVSAASVITPNRLSLGMGIVVPPKLASCNEKEEAYRQTVIKASKSQVR